jgi:hypothetical protein
MSMGIRRKQSHGFRNNRNVAEGPILHGRLWETIHLGSLPSRQEDQVDSSGAEQRERCKEQHLFFGDVYESPERMTRDSLRVLEEGMKEAVLDGACKLL